MLITESRSDIELYFTVLSGSRLKRYLKAGLLKISSIVLRLFRWHSIKANNIKKVVKDLDKEEQIGNIAGDVSIELEKKVEEMCQRLLTNPVIHSYNIEIKEK